MDDEIMLAALIYFMFQFQAIYQLLLNDFEHDQQRLRRRVIIQVLNDGPRPIVKTGTHSRLFLEMNDNTFRRHLRLNRNQFELLNNRLGEMGLAEVPPEMGGHSRIQQERKTLMFLWYMANTNSFRELSDKFDVSQSSAHQIITPSLGFITWPNECVKKRSSAVFQHQTRLEGIIGAIDGCHIRIISPSKHGADYMNRKGYHSILLQGICDEKGRFIDVFVEPPGRVHDSRLLRLSPFDQNRHNKMGEHKLLGDSAYISQDFQEFICTPKRDNGPLRDCDRQANMHLCRGRVIIENAFGRLKCRFRRIRDVQNAQLLTIVQLVYFAQRVYGI